MDSFAEKIEWKGISMQNVAILISTLSGGGAERVAGYLSKELSSYYNVYLFMNEKYKLDYEYAGTVVYLDGDDYFFEASLKNNKEKYKIDYCISFMEQMNFANIRTKGKENVIISERCTQSKVYPPRYTENLKIQRYYPRADRIVACSHGVKYNLEKNFHITNEIDVIYNFVDEEAIRLKQRDDLSQEIKDFLDGAPYFLYVGRFHSEKNPLRIIAQFSYFHEHYDDRPKLIMLGDGNLKNEMSARICELGLEKCVELVSRTSNPFSYMSNAAALILSSRHEGLPNVIIEAMCVGCPVISVDCMSGPRELIEDITDYRESLASLYRGKRGILVTNEASEDSVNSHFMADAMKIIVGDTAYVKKIKYNQEVYIKEYERESLVKKWLNILNYCTKNGDNAAEKLENNENLNCYIIGYGYFAEKTAEYVKKIMKKDYTIVSYEDFQNNFNGKIMDGKHLQSDYELLIPTGSQDKQDILIEMIDEEDYDKVFYPMIPMDIYYRDSIDMLQQDFDHGKYRGAVIFGLGKYGEATILELKSRKIPIKAIFDNRIKEREYDGIQILCPCNMGDDLAYIITCYSTLNKENMEEQLLKYNVNKNNIFFIHG